MGCGPVLSAATPLKSKLMWKCTLKVNMSSRKVLAARSVSFFAQIESHWATTWLVSTGTLKLNNSFSLCTELDFLIISKMAKVSEASGGTAWKCTECGYESKYKTNVMEHVESKHVQSSGVVCSFCSAVCVNRKGLRNHVYKYHRKQ